jgi:hypothetical protein
VGMENPATVSVTWLEEVAAPKPRFAPRLWIADEAVSLAWADYSAVRANRGLRASWLKSLLRDGIAFLPRSLASRFISWLSDRDELRKSLQYPPSAGPVKPGIQRARAGAAHRQSLPRAGPGLGIIRCFARAAGPGRSAGHPDLVTLPKNLLSGAGRALILF